VPLARFDKLDRDRQRRLLAAAAQEFAAHGFDGASVGRITDAAGMSKAALYYYFHDKSDLYGAAIHEAWRTLLPNGELALNDLDAATFWPRLERFYLDLLERARQEPWLAAAGKLVYHLEPSAGAGPLVAEQFHKARSFLKDLIRRGQALGVVRRDLPEGLLLALVAGAAEAADHWSVEHWDGFPPAEFDQLARRVFDTLRGIALPPAAGERP
jgi:AcrR family transcriptional regulator